MNTNANDSAMACDRIVFNCTEDILVAMEDKNITKAELAKLLNVTKSYVTQLLNGQRNMTLNTLSNICFVLDIEPSIIFNYSKNEFVVPPADNPNPNVTCIKYPTIINCNSCGSSNASHTTKDIMRKTLMLKDIKGIHCGDCGEIELNESEATYYLDQLRLAIGRTYKKG